MPEHAKRPRVEKPDEGLPWQIIYSAFLGVLLCACGLYAGYYLAGSGLGTAAKTGGIATVLAAVALAASFVALMMAQRWALVVCRIVSPLFAICSLGGLVYGLVRVIRSLDWSLSGTSIWRGALDVLSDPRVIVPLIALTVSTMIVLLLFGKVTARFVER